MCAADASDMLRHRDFTSMHAHLLSRWLHLPTGLGSNKTNVSVAKYSRDISRVDSRQGMKRCKHACAIYSITGTSLLHPNTHKWCNHHHLQRCTNLLAQNLQFSIWYLDITTSSETFVTWINDDQMLLVSLPSFMMMAVFPFFPYPSGYRYYQTGIAF